MFVFAGEEIILGEGVASGSVWIDALIFLACSLFVFSLLFQIGFGTISLSPL